jgi:hypothetical protein
MTKQERINQLDADLKVCRANVLTLRAERDKLVLALADCMDAQTPEEPPPPTSPTYTAFDAMPLGQTVHNQVPGFQTGWGGELPWVVIPTTRPGHCAKFSLADGEGRSELVVGNGEAKMIPMGATTTFKFGFLIERMDNWGASGGHNLIYQYQGGGPNLESSPKFSLALFDFEGKGLYAHGGIPGWARKLAPLDVGRWYDIEVKATCSNTNGGMIQVLLDGSLVYHRTGDNTVRSDQLWGYQKFGLYRNPSTVRGQSDLLIDC